jgi:hypothetical protein
VVPKQCPLQKCLVSICRDFEELKGFLQNQTPQKEELVHKLFLEFMECFGSLKEKKLEYPKEFINDVKLFHEGFEPLLKKFEDVQIRYLLLSDFYDFARLTKRYKKAI